MIKLNKSTRYALYAAMEMAQAGEDVPVTAARVAKRFGLPAAVLAKVFQQLVREGIAVGTRGSRGGYRLLRRPTELTILEVLEVFEPRRLSGQCLFEERDKRDCAQHGDWRLRALFDEVDEVARSTFASITFETLIGRPRPGMGLPLARQAR